MNRFRFTVRSDVNPLHTGLFEGNLYSEYLYDCPLDVWQPHFQDLLMYVLNDQIFPRLGAITTLSDAAPRMLRVREYDKYVTTLVLAGERDRAVEVVEDVARASLMRRSWVERDLVRDIETVCGEAHDREAEVIKLLKLEKIWEPSPFPAELPASEPAGRSAEPPFVTTPWPERPPSLIEDAPVLSGEVRFAKEIYWPGETPFLLAALSREDAATRHRNMEHYAVEARLPEDILVVLRRGAHARDPHHPDHGSEQGRLSVEVEMLGVQSTVEALFVGLDETAVLKLFDARVTEPATTRRAWVRRPIWEYRVNSDQSAAIIERRGKDEESKIRRPVTEGERALLTCPDPTFGDVEGILAHLRAFLRVAGFGEVR